MLHLSTLCEIRNMKEDTDEYDMSQSVTWSLSGDGGTSTNCPVLFLSLPLPLRTSTDF